MAESKGGSRQRKCCMLELPKIKVSKFKTPSLGETDALDIRGGSILKYYMQSMVRWISKVSLQHDLKYSN